MSPSISASDECARSTPALVVDPIALPGVKHIDLLVIADHKRRVYMADERSHHVIVLIKNAANLDGSIAAIPTEILAINQEWWTDSVRNLIGCHDKLTFNEMPYKARS